MVKRRINSGSLMGFPMLVEGRLEDVFSEPGLTLETLLARGHETAVSAMERAQYTADDEPFVFGKVGRYDAIVSEKELGDE